MVFYFQKRTQVKKGTGAQQETYGATHTMIVIMAL